MERHQGYERSLGAPDYLMISGELEPHRRLEDTEMGGCLDSRCARLDITMFRRARALDLEPEEIKEGRFRLDPDDSTAGAVCWGIGADEQGKPHGLALLHESPGGQRVTYGVQFTTSRCNFGGGRYWFICPTQGCGRRVRVLYLAPSATHFACRHCAEVIYSVTRESPNQRLARRMAKLQSRLGGADPLGGPRPKGMHRKTFTRVSILHAAMSVQRHTEALDAMLKQEGLADLVSD